MAYSEVPSSQTGAVQVPQNRIPGQQVFTGAVMFDRPTVYAVGTVAATGTSQATAAALPNTPMAEVSGATGTTGVILPQAGPGISLVIYSSAATNGLKVYPHAGGNINNGTPDAAVTIVARTPSRFISINSLTWVGGYVAPI